MKRDVPHENDQCCPICGARSGDVRLESPWLTVTCSTCGNFRITFVAAAVIELYCLAVRERVAGLTHRAWLAEAPLDLDLDGIDRLLASD